jgi:hypothetical protein
MEPIATMAFAISLSAINLAPMPIDQCVTWKTEQPEQRLCVEVEPPCGKSIGTECLGRADFDEVKKPKAKPKKKRTTTAKRTSTKRYARR